MYLQIDSDITTECRYEKIRGGISQASCLKILQYSFLRPVLCKSRLTSLMWTQTHQSYINPDTPILCESRHTNLTSTQTYQSYVNTDTPILRQPRHTSLMWTETHQYYVNPDTPVLCEETHQYYVNPDTLVLCEQRHTNLTSAQTHQSHQLSCHFRKPPSVWTSIKSATFRLAVWPALGQ